MPRSLSPSTHAAAISASSAESEAAPRKKRGRKPGKHSDQNYTQTSIYLPKELRNRVRARLYERGMEMSGLLEQMLRDWLRSNGEVRMALVSSDSPPRIGP